MTDRVNFTKRELSLLLTNLIIAKMLFSYPRFLFKTSGNAAWIEALYMSLIVFGMLLLSFLFFKYTGNRSIIELSEMVGGMFLKIVVSTLVSLIILANIATEMRMFAESVKIILLPKTQIELIMILFAITVTIGACSGLGALATINSLFLPVCLFFLAALVLFLIPAYNINNIFPIMGTGAGDVFLRSFRDMSGFSDLIALNLLLPHCSDISIVKKSGKTAVLLGGIVLFSICLSYALIYPYPYSTEFLLIPYQLSRMVRAGEYFQRFEAFFEFVWSITQLIYSSLYVFLLADIWRKTFRLRYTKPLIPCFVAIMSLISFEQSTIIEVLDTTYNFKAPLVPIAYLLPIMVPLFYIISRRDKNES